MERGTILQDDGYFRLVLLDVAVDPHNYNRPATSAVQTVLFDKEYGFVTISDNGQSVCLSRVAFEALLSARQAWDFSQEKPADPRPADSREDGRDDFDPFLPID